LNLKDYDKFSNDEDELIEGIHVVEMCNYFELLCTCCDKKKVDEKILPKITKRRNLDLFQTLYNRPKYVDTQILMTFVSVLSRYLSEKLDLRNCIKKGLEYFKIFAFSIGVKSDQKTVNEIHAKTDDPQVIEIKSKLLENLERTFNHLEFGRYLHKETITQDIVDINRMNHLSKVSTSNSKFTNSNISFIYKESLKLFSDDTLDPIVRFNFSRFIVPKLICFVSGGSIFNQQISTSSLSTITDKSNIAIPASEDINSIVSTSIYNLQNEPQLEHNFNLENTLCEGFLRAKASRNKLDLFMYMISLGRFALSLKKCDEYMFVCVKHLLEIFDSNECDKWSMFASALAQRQLFIMSKRINMQELLGEFEEKGSYNCLYLILCLYMAKKKTK